MTRPPVVFVHGIRVSGAAWSDQVRLLEARNIRTAVVDLPAHGSRRGDQFSVDAATDTIAEAIDHVGGQALVVGHSLGGYMTIAAAARFPQRFAGMLVAGATAIPNRVFGLPFLAGYHVLRRLPDGGEAASRALLSRFASGALVDEIMAAGIATEAVPDVVREVADFDVLEALRSFSGPVWLVNGTLDHFRLHERRFAAVAGVELRHVRRAGHYLPTTHPEEFAAIVAEAVDTLAPLTPRGGNS
ncbi:alpha/beta hydrolase [Hoyosella sp. YIM 151337]|uniref:alpha/beta fold hydrolase n=1 Tax=Hoyosella sp. YIM 151337 TaxID=2992742 RepID=UPI002235788D|nr:alpha/beta hydrolase [Hoyosella sp. YIM 151337]MCW4351714.1 alpha/beta hydrolase [Hoyosella sp. YIM 151337]